MKEDSSNSNGYYLARKNNNIKDLLIERMERDNWSYVRQDGSGYFFGKGDQQTS